MQTGDLCIRVGTAVGRVEKKSIEHVLAHQEFLLPKGSETGKDDGGYD
jgi:hypothetical protein